MDSNQIQIIILVVLIALSAIFSASETALMALNKIKVRNMVEENVKGAKLLEKIIEKPDKLLSTILVGNNIVNILASAIATTVATTAFGAGGVAIATAAMTVFVLIFGEITPKSIAALSPAKVGLRFSKFIAFVIFILTPIVAIFNYITSIILKLIGGGTRSTTSFTQEEIKTIVEVGREEGVLHEDAKEMIHNVFDFGDLRVSEIMVQRLDIVTIEDTCTYEEIVTLIKEERVSRIPVYNDNVDNIIGVVNVKELFSIMDDYQNFDVKKYMKQPHYTFETKKISKLFSEMKESKIYMSIVLDEYGGTAGIITLKDIVTEIVGDISGHDEDDLEISKIGEQKYEVTASMRIDDFNEMMGTNIQSKKVDSIGGFIITKLERLAKVGDKVYYENMIFKVEEIERNRIEKISVLIK